MSSKRIFKNIEIEGIRYDVFYDSDENSATAGQILLKTPVVGGQGGTKTGGDIVYNSLTDQNSTAENAIKSNETIIKRITKSGGPTPGFISSDDIVLGGGAGGLSQGVAQAFQNTEGKYGKDVFFDGKKSAQYPIDALYGRTNFVQTSGESQDHLVISQYKYKPPRADDIWGKTQPGVIITQGIARNSPLDEFLGLVKMPMPNAIQDSNNVAWGEDTVNALEAAALNTVQPKLADILKSGGTGLVAGATDLVFGGSGSAGSSAMAAQVLGRIGGGAITEGNFGSTVLAPEAVARILGAAGIETSAEAILARKEGVVPNSNLELLFSGPTLRQFAFVYKMSPRSREEARTVNQILRFFKQGMAAKKLLSTAGDSDGRSYFLGTPNVFRLQYRTTEDEAVKGLNRIKTCALTGTSVNYTPEGAFASYDKGQPVSVLLSLNFQELEPIYDTDYKYKGDADERQSDTDEGYRWKLTSEEVGY